VSGSSPCMQGVLEQRIKSALACSQ
jgi:hypothetical protein